MKLLQICVVTQFLCRYSISIGSCCNNVSCIVSIPQVCVATQFLCRDSISVGSCYNNVSCIVSIPVAIESCLHVT